MQRIDRKDVLLVPTSGMREQLGFRKGTCGILKSYLVFSEIKVHAGPVSLWV